MKKFDNEAVIFGGSGFLGEAVINELLTLGYNVINLDIQEPKSFQTKKYKFYKCDILNPDSYRKILKDSQVIYHFAGKADLEGSIVDPYSYINTNIIGTTNILEILKSKKPKRFIYASSAYALSENGAFYGLSKKTCEKIIEEYQKQFNINFTIIRYGSVYGPNADNSNRIFKFISQAFKENKIVFSGTGDETREYIHVSDAAKLSVSLLGKKGLNKNFILTGAEKLTYKNLLMMMNEIFDNKLEIRFLNKSYEGHYKITPYQFKPELGYKIINNPSIDFGQGLVECIDYYYKNIKV